MSDITPFDDPLDNEPEPEIEFNPIEELRWEDISGEALNLLGEYVNITDTGTAKVWAGQQLRLLALADATGDTDFIRNYPRALSLLARSQGVKIARGREQLVRDRFLLVGRLVLRLLLK